MTSKFSRIQMCPLTEKDSKTIEKLAKEWGCPEGRLLGIAVHEWLKTI